MLPPRSPPSLTTFDVDLTTEAALSGAVFCYLGDTSREDSRQEAIKASDITATVLINAPFAKVAEKFIW